MSVVIETTTGDITVDLFVDERPNTCKNFLKLCKIKYYNFCLFHDVQRNFIAQTGDPSGTGRGGESVYCRLYGEQAKYIQWETKPKLKHRKRGLISMVNNGDNMHGSQFYFTLSEDLDTLDGVHTIFGEVSEGFEVLEKIGEILVDEEHRPYKDIRITHTIILEDPFEDPPGMVVPAKSPEVTDEIIKNSRLLEEEDNEGKTPQQIAEEEAEKEAKARAIVLEMIGDLPSADVAPPENVLFVCKLNPVTTDEDLEIIFSRFGEIVSCEVVRDRKTGNSLQYAFIEFKEAKSCEDAYFKMDNVLIDDRRIHVDFSQSVAKYKEWTKLKRGRMDKEANGKQERRSRDRSPRRRMDSRNSSAHSSSSRRTESGEIRTPRRDGDGKERASSSRSGSHHTVRTRDNDDRRRSPRGERTSSLRRRSRSRSDSRSTKRKSRSRSRTRDSRSRSRSRSRGGRPMPGVDSFYRRNQNRARWNQNGNQRNSDGHRGGQRGWNRGYLSDNRFNNYRNNGYHHRNNQYGNNGYSNYQNSRFQNNSNNYRSNFQSSNFRPTGHSNNYHNQGYSAQRGGHSTNYRNNASLNNHGGQSNWNSWQPQNQIPPIVNSQNPQQYRSHNNPNHMQNQQQQLMPRNQLGNQYQGTQVVCQVQRWTNAPGNPGQWSVGGSNRHFGYNNNGSRYWTQVERQQEDGNSSIRQRERSASPARRERSRSTSRPRERRTSPSVDGERRKQRERSPRVLSKERSPSQSSSSRRKQPVALEKGDVHGGTKKEKVEESKKSKVKEADKTKKRKKEESSSSESSDSDSSGGSSSSSSEEDRKKKKKRKKSKKEKRSKHHRKSKSKSKRNS